MTASVPITALGLQQASVPTKVRWIKKRSHTDLIKTIPSKSTRAFFRAIPTLLSEQHYVVSWSSAISKATFSEWLVYYEKKSEELDYTVFANLEWYDRMTAAGHTVTLVSISQNSALVAAGIILEKSNRVSLAFKSSERLDLSSRSNTNLGTCIDYLFMERYWQDERQLSAGTSRNAFGVVNNLGHLEFKLRLGYEAVLLDKPNYKESVEVTAAGYAFFYAHVQDAFTLHCIVPENNNSILADIFVRYPLQQQSPTIITYAESAIA